MLKYNSKEHDLYILLVEDDRVDQMAFERYFKTELSNHSLVVAGSLSQAKVLLSDLSFDIIFSDLNLGDGSAFDLPALSDSASLVLLTGAGDEETAVRAIREGFSDYLIKDHDRAYLQLIPIITKRISDQAKDRRELMILKKGVESAVDAIVTTDVEGVINYANPAITKLTGYSVDELQGNTPRLWKSDNEPASFYKQMWDSILEGNVWQGEVYNKRKDGSVYCALLHISPIFDDHNRIEGFVAVQEDITVKKTLEKERDSFFRQISELAEYNLNLIEMSPIGIWVVDTFYYEKKLVESYDRSTLYQDMNTVLATSHINNKMANILGYEKKDLVNLPVLDHLFFDDENASKFVDLVKQKNDNQSNQESDEIALNHKDGHLIPFHLEVKKLFSDDVSRESNQWIITLIDLSQIKKAEAEIKWLSHGVKSAGESIVMTDRKGIITYVNPAFSKLTGYSIEEAIGRTPSILKSGEYDQSFYKKMWTDVLEGKVWSQEIKNKKKDGSYYQSKLTIAPIFKTSNVIEGFIAVQSDISEQKRLESEITKSLKEKELLLREVHHRVKNNMQVISSLLNLQMRYIKDDGYREIFKDSQNRIKSMALIHENLYQSDAINCIGIYRYVKKLVDDLVRSYSLNTNQVSTVVDIDRSLMLTVDQAIPCGLIINELITNSFKHAFPEGRKGVVTISLKQNDRSYTLKVSDNGVGLPGEVDLKKSSSLGLQLVPTLAEGQLGGTLSLNRGEGIEFCVNFEEPIA